MWATEPEGETVLLRTRARATTRRGSLRLAAALLLAACGPSFESPTAPQGPPPNPFGYTPETSLPPAGAVEAGPTSAGPRPATTFVRTQSSDDWVRQTFQVQDKYDRVILVDPKAGPGDTGERRVSVPKLDLNDRAGGAQRESLAVTTSVQTLADAALIVRGGDLVAIAPGRYAGFTLQARPGTGDGKYIRFVALGQPGEVVIDRPTLSDLNWMIELRATSHVILEGIHLAGESSMGRGAADTPRAGIFINGNFAQSGVMSHHIAITGVYSHHHRRWGMHSVYSHTVLMQDSVYAESGDEHCAYVSDSSDNYVIRRNIFARCNKAGLQVNLDPTASFDTLAAHPDMRSIGGVEYNRAWAVAAIAKGTEVFGENNFPDGRGENFLIEENVVTGNGLAGAGAFNFAAMSRSLVQNNLLYDNHAHGIAQWDDENEFDTAAREPGPRAPSDVTGPDSLPLFGCQENVIRNNTVLMARAGRAAMQSGNGSFGTRVYNNVLINDVGPSIEIAPTAMLGFDAGHNVIGSVNYLGAAAQLTGLAKSSPDGNRSVLGLSQQRFFLEVKSGSLEPWIDAGASGWSLHPRRPDFRPRPGAPLLVGRGDPAELPPRDLFGKPRSGPVIGAFVP